MCLHSTNGQEAVCSTRCIHICNPSLRPGPSTIVGSAAFNLLVIIAVCTYSLEEYKRITQYASLNLLLRVNTHILCCLPRITTQYALTQRITSLPLFAKYDVPKQWIGDVLFCYFYRVPALWVPKGPNQHPSRIQNIEV